MKALFLILASTIGLSSCSNKFKAKSTKPIQSVVSFTRSKIDIGNVLVGTTKEIKFYAINKSNIPLLINSVKSSCACTVSEFPKTPIMQNDSGLILAKYTPNQTNIGTLNKSIVVLANTTHPFTVLTFTGNVIENR
jgi:hypothetical protein